jgi:hypothetical protein
MLHGKPDATWDAGCDVLAIVEVIRAASMHTSSVSALLEMYMVAAAMLPPAVRELTLAFVKADPDG